MSPNPNSPAEGIYRFNVKHLTNLEADQEILTNQRNEARQLLDKIFISSRAIDRESLCVASGKLVWKIEINLSILTFDGNFLDPIFFTALLCLSRTMLPEVRITGTKVRVFKASERPLKPINVHHMPVPITFNFIDIHPDLILIDPDLNESKLVTSVNTIFMNVFGDVCGIHTLGVLDMEVDRYIKLMEIA